MHSIDDLLDGYRAFRNGAYVRQARLYAELGAGQDPDIMIIGCADSRAEPADIFNAAPGQLFVVRNVANLVPPYDMSGGLHGVSAAVEFAALVLKVRHIVVMGHGGCGGISACNDALRGQAFGQFIAPWVEIAAKARAAVHAACGPGADRATLNARLERVAIGASLDNLMSFPFVRRAVEAGSLQLHGAWFAIASGELHWRDPDSGAFAPVSP